MKFRCSLTVAAVIALATPVGLFTAAPALAATGTSAAQTQNQAPTYTELVKAAADAKKAYEEAVTAGAEGQKKLKAALEALDSDTHPLKAARIAADTAAKEAAGVRSSAEKAVEDAKAELAAAQSDAEKAAAQLGLTAAEAELAKAVEAQEQADAAAEQAGTAWDDARVAAVREYSLVQSTLEKALAAKETAEAALAAAKKCVDENGLTSLAIGLPSKVVAGTTVNFTLRVTNGTDRTLTVDPLAFFHVAGEPRGEKGLLEVDWSNGSAWHTLSGDVPEHIAHSDSMKPGERSDVKLRMKVRSVARPAEAFALLATDASDAYNPCVLGPMKRYDFALLPAGSKPGPAGEAKPEQPAENDDQRPDAAKPGTDTGPSAQGGTTKPAAPTGTDANGKLATTGTPSTVTPLALAGAAAVALGAGAVFAVRRRKATGTI